MADSLLSILNITPQQVPRLAAAARTRLLNFLISWEAFDEALACLAEFNLKRFISLQDFQARALNGLGRSDEAIQVMQQRVQKKPTATAQELLGRCLLDAGHIQAARKIAVALTNDAETSGPNWSFLGDIYLRNGDLDAAEHAYLTHQGLASSSRLSLFGLARVHQRRGDLVTAAAYGVRAYTVEDGQSPIPIDLLQQLIEFFIEIAGWFRNRLTKKRVR